MSHSKNEPMGSSPDSTVFAWRKKSQKVKCSPNPRKARKIGERGGKKSTVGTLSKKWLFGLFCREERKANRRNGNQKYRCKDRKNCLGEKSRGCCRQRACVIPRHLFSAEQEQLRGGKMLGCFSWTKRGTHDSLWSKRKGKKKWGKYTEKKEKAIVIGYAYLSQGKHITSDVDRLFKTRGQRKKTEKMEHGIESTKQDKSGGSVMDLVPVDRTEMEAIPWMDGLTARMNLDYFHSVNVSSALLPLIGVPPGWIIWMQIRLERRSISTRR